MSVGFFMGIHASYTEESQASAANLIKAINVALKQAKLPPYVEPAELPDVYNDGHFGRSGLDHHSAGALMNLAEQASQRLNAPHLELLTKNPYRVAYLPIDFGSPLLTDHTERIFNSVADIWVGSAPRLREELIEYALLLGIPLTSGELSDDVATMIDNETPLAPGDGDDLIEERTAWLVLYEGARLAVEHGVALSLAG